MRGNKMNYSSDKPVEKASQDLLGRSFFSKQFGKAIYEYSLSDGLVIGLFGKWGTGKTSVINMALDEIEELSTKDEVKPIILKFSPWNYSDKDNLTKMYFQCLKGKVAKRKKQVNWEKVGKALDDYSDAFDAISLAPIPGSNWISTLLKKTAKTQGQRLAEGESLDDTKQKLEKALINAGQKIIVVIDDIDRLTNSQIRDIFQLVKQVANFPNVIYVLAMDRDVVTRALNDVNAGDGQEYLEKIVQVTFEIPELKKNRLHEVFFTKLDYVLKSIPDGVRWDRQYWGEVFRNCIAPYLETMRDVNRVINTFQFRYSLLYQETAFEDMIAIATLEVLNPKLYKWIIQNKESLCGGFAHSFLNGPRDNKIDYKKIYEEEFNSLGIDCETALPCLSTLFPVFAKDVNKFSWGYQPTANVRSKMRVAQDSRFDLYFMSDMEDVKVSRSIINKCIYELDKEEIEKVITQINSQNNTVYFLEEFRSLVDDIPYERLSIIALALLSGVTRFNGENRKNIFTVSAFDYVEYLVKDILMRLKTSEERTDVLRIALNNVSRNGISTIAYIINSIELAYGRLAGKSEEVEMQIIKLAQLEELEKQYVDRITELSKEDVLLDIDGYGMVIYLWECFDKIGAQAYIRELLKDDITKIKYICSLAGRWNGTNGSGWSFYSSNYSDYVSDEEIYELIKNLDREKLDEFSDVDQIKMASFLLNYNKDEMDYVTEEDAREYIKNWKKKEI